MKQTNINKNIWWQWGGMNLVVKGACLAAAIPLLYLMIASAFGGGGALVVVSIGGSFVLLFLWSVAMGWVQGRFWRRYLPQMQGWQAATRWALVFFAVVAFVTGLSLLNDSNDLLRFMNDLLGITRQGLGRMEYYEVQGAVRLGVVLFVWLLAYFGLSSAWQWRVLRSFLPNAGWWVGGSLLAGVVGVVLGTAVNGTLGAILAVVTADLLQGVVLLGLLQRGLAGNGRWHNDYKIVGGAALIMGVAVIAFLLLPSPINRTSSAAFASVGCEASVMGSSGDNGLGIGRLVSVKTGGHKDMIDTLTMLPDGSGLLTASRDGTVRLWQWPCLQEKLVLPTASNFNDSAPVSVTGDGRYLVTKNPRSEIIIVELATGETVQVAARMIGDVTAVSPDGQYIAASNKDIIHVYNFADGREICQFTAHEEASPITNILFTPDSQRVLSVAYYDGVHVWQPTTCTEELVLERPYYAIDQIVVHPNGQFVAASTSQESQVYVWNLTTGQTMFERQRISDDNWMGNILFAPDGRTLIAGGDYGTLRIWDWQTGVEIYHNTIPDLSRVAITPDGQQLITMTHNGAVTTLNWEEMIE